jgi:hypothetical protein
MWGFYNMSDVEIAANALGSLREYLPTETEANRDLGNYTNGDFRFGAKHNDIYPIIGDMIRWKLGLPKRKKEPVQIKIETSN